MKFKAILKLLKNGQISLSAIKIFLLFSAISLMLSWLLLSVSDNAHISRIEAYQYTPDTVSAELPIVSPLLASHERGLQNYDIRDQRIDLQGEYDSLAIRRLRTISSRKPIDGNYESYWDLFRWNLLTYDYDATRYYFRGWLSLADKDAIDPEYGTEEVYEGTDLAYERYKVNISSDDYYYYGSSPNRINPTRFTQAINSTLTAAIDQYIATGAYGIASELHDLRWELMESYHLNAELFSSQGANRLMLLRILFMDSDENFRNYDDFRYLYDYISRFEWTEGRTNRTFQSARHQCLADFLNAANGIYDNSFELRPIIFVERIREYRRGSCVEDAAFEEVATLLELKAIILALAGKTDAETIAGLAANELHQNLDTEVWHAEFEPKVFVSLHDDWVDYMQNISAHINSVVEPDDLSESTDLDEAFSDESR
ncbi:hypothetical protein DXV76_20890 [Rhodobacteraceae bacterium CCMM004]|nr:hypothetical protein DXV76_20890 [Rhodobacteraceae bacterium CCMM004]